MRKSVILPFVLVFALAGVGSVANPDPVNWPDLAVFAEQWLAEECSADNWCDGADLDYSDSVDFADFNIFAQHWLKKTDAAYYVAPYGDDSNPGTLMRPFKTIQKAADVIQPGDTCYIRGGSYHEEVVINNLNGTAENPVTFTNYQEEEVTLDGTIQITSVWTQHNGGIYKTTLTEDVWQLFVDGTMQVTARWPNVTLGHPCDEFRAKNNGWEPKNGTWWSQETTWAKGATNQSNTGKVINNPAYHDLAAENVSFEGGSIILNHWSETTFERQITSHAAGSDTLWHDPVIDPHDKGKPWFVIEHLNALDMPGEWYYTPVDKTLYLWADDGQDPTGRDIRGKTITYALDMDGCRYITIKGVSFFGATINSQNGAYITLEDCHFSYPSCFRRILGEYHKGPENDRPDQTSLKGDNAGTFYTVRNCVFEYTEGKALNLFKGEGNVVENCLFHHVDFTGLGQFGIDMRKDATGAFIRNTFHTGGASAGLKHWEIPITLNHFYWFGYLQKDGTAFQTPGGHAPGCVRSYNWVHHTPKMLGRWDGYDGTYGTMHHNVGWVGGKCQVKGDYHETHNNTHFDAADNKNDITILDVNGSGEPRNQNSRTMNNLANKISGDRKKDVWTHPIPGFHSNNWNGYITGKDVRTQLRDADSFDFRPKLGSDIIDAGVILPGITDGFVGAAPDIGAYEYGDPNYWIPGYQTAKASTPIPPDNAANVKLDADLMWLGGYKASSHDIYFGESKDAVANANRASDEYKGNQTNNIFEPGTLDPDTTYYWRIDAFDANGNVKTPGDVWSFTTR